MRCLRARSGWRTAGPARGWGVRARDVVSEAFGIGRAKAAALPGSETCQCCGVGAVERENIAGYECVEADEDLLAHQVPRRALGPAPRCFSHQLSHWFGPVGPSADVQTQRVVGALVDGTDVQHPDGGEGNAEHADGFA